MKKKLLAILTAIFMLSFIMVGCGEEPQSKTEQTKENIVQSDNITSAKSDTETKADSTKSDEAKNTTSTNTNISTSSNNTPSNTSSKASETSGVVSGGSTTSSGSNSSSSGNYTKSSTTHSSQPKASTKKSTPAPAQQVDSESGNYVYANGGRSKSNKYHSSPHAHKMEGAIKMTVQQAEAQGYVACKKCF
ncbi:hypothetical protein QYB59_001665 [Clostridium perfringens]|nr:hypothetical protein [Clostridium perfringens]